LLIVVCCLVGTDGTGPFPWEGEAPPTHPAQLQIPLDIVLLLYICCAIFGNEPKLDCWNNNMPGVLSMLLYCLLFDLLMDKVQGPHFKNSGSKVIVSHA